MPRDGSGIYSQPFPDVVAGTEVESAVYNGFTADVTQDFNNPRPILAGGTGSTNAPQALGALGAERSGDVVTNYDSHIFYAGSFSSASSATGGPVASHAFAGIAYDSDAIGAAPDYVPLNQNVIVEVRDQNDTVTPGRKYVREKKAGVWGSWYTDGITTIGDAGGIGNPTADMFVGLEGTSPASAFVVNSESDNSGVDLLRVRKDGGATVRVAAGGAGLAMDKAASGQDADLLGRTNGANRWIMRMGNSVAESGSNAGSDFQLIRYDDAGVGVGMMHAFRASGNVSFESNVAVGGVLNVTGTSTLTGAVTTVGNVTIGTGSSGALFFGNSGTRYLNYDGTSYNFGPGPTVTATNFTAAGEITAGTRSSAHAAYGFTINSFAGAGTVPSPYICQSLTCNPSFGALNLQGIHISGVWAGWRMEVSGNFFDFRNNGVAYNLAGGAWTAYSDARIKDVVGEYRSGLDAIAALQPVRYKFKDSYTRDSREFIGLLAQEAEQSMPELVTREPGHIDGVAVADLRAMNITPVIYALINAVKELKARVEELEAAR